MENKREGKVTREIEGRNRRKRRNVIKNIIKLDWMKYTRG